MEVTTLHITSSMVDEIQMLADMTIGKGLVKTDEIIAAVDGDLSFVLKSNDNCIIGYSLNEAIEPEVLSFILSKCDTVTKKLKTTDSDNHRMANMSALGILPQYQGYGYGKVLFTTVISNLKQRFDIITALAWKKGEVVPMKKLLEQAGFIYFGLLKSPYKDAPGIYCDYCKSSSCVCDSCLYIWESDF